MKIKNIGVFVFLFSLVGIISALANDVSNLMAASGSGETETVRILLEKGVDVNATDSYGFTALMFAAKYGHTTTVRFLLAKGAEVNVKSKLLGYTALMNAVASRKVIIVKELLDRGADVNARNDDGVTALTFAEELNDAVIIKLLKRHGATK
ncbi:MAG: ankyrin repeat domain-containing protein [Thermoplasmatales archaeon]|nr:ankyrin repeat domain-containing protein [Thermoplasmatales archaeon]